MSRFDNQSRHVAKALPGAPCPGKMCRSRSNDLQRVCEVTGHRNSVRRRVDGDGADENLAIAGQPHLEPRLATRSRAGPATRASAARSERRDQNPSDPGSWRGHFVRPAALHAGETRCSCHPPCLGPRDAARRSRWRRVRVWRLSTRRQRQVARKALRPAVAEARMVVNRISRKSPQSPLIGRPRLVGRHRGHASEPTPAREPIASEPL